MSSLNLIQFLSIAVLIACSHAIDETKMRLYGYSSGADGDMLLNGCPANMPHRYPGTNRCFQTIWGPVSCNVDVVNDPIPHHANDQQCNFASTVDHYGIVMANGCPSQMPHKYPGTDRCFAELWTGGHCNINAVDAKDRSWNRMCLYDAPVYRTAPVVFTKPGQQLVVEGDTRSPFAEFSTYMYEVICPEAATHYIEGWRCETTSKHKYPLTRTESGDVCREYYLFVNEQQADRYFEAVWTNKLPGANDAMAQCMTFNPDEIEVVSDGPTVFAGLANMGCCRTSDATCRTPITGRLLLEKMNLEVGDFE